MPIYYGSNKISEVYNGSESIKELYNGSDLVFSSFTPVTYRFDYTGDVQTFTVPSGCNKLIVDCVGAAGYTYTHEDLTTTPSFGGRVECELSVKTGETLYIYVGQAGGDNVSGWNGGGACSSYDSRYAGGGGASDIRISGMSLEDRKVVAGGSGGCNFFSGGGGNGGGLIGGNARDMDSGYATGGTQTAGGTGGAGGGYGDGGNGSFGTGGYTPSMGGGGGGGWYGGGGGSGGLWAIGNAGAGGSSYTDPDLCTNVVHTQGYSEATGNGWIIITTAK